MKQFYFGWVILLAVISFSTCPVNFDDKPSSDDEPNYNLPVVWKSDVLRPFSSQMTSDRDGVYILNFMENDFSTVKLNKLNPLTGITIWSTDYFEEVSVYQPIITDSCIYVTLWDSGILCFDKESGRQLARVKITGDNPNMWVTSNYFLYDNYFYFGYGEEITTDIVIDDFYLARINANSIVMDGNTREQPIEPELLWQGRYKSCILSLPIVYNNILYCNTKTLDITIPVEIAGIDINTKKELFYDSFGGDRDYIFDHGWERNSLYIKDDIMYYLSWSIAAYDITNYKKLYHIIFDNSTPKNKNYSAGDFLDITFHNNKIYYTTTGTNYLGDTGSRNIFCINKNDGKLVWSAIPRKSESLGTNPVIYNGKVFIPHMNGVRVYNADNGKLIGVEKSIEGNSICFNQLIGSIMITDSLSDEYPDGQLIALDLDGQY
jgi:outer membrane protein assembly factor BamB